MTSFIIFSKNIHFFGIFRKILFFRANSVRTRKIIFFSLKTIYEYHKLFAISTISPIKTNSVVGSVNNKTSKTIRAHYYVKKQMMKKQVNKNTTTYFRCVHFLLTHFQSSSDVLRNNIRKCG